MLVNTNLKVFDKKSQLELNISVVAANYNNALFLDDFFKSWQTSICVPKELIFVDDGSKDNSLEIAYRYQKNMPNLIIIPLGKNQGFGNALNIGIEKSTCKYILRIDPDDIVLPDRLAKQYDVLELGEYDIVGSNATAFNSANNKIVSSTNFPLKHDEILKTYYKGEHGVLHGTVMGRTELFKKHKYIQQNVPAEDYDIFARMIKSGARFINLSENLLKYRIHLTSASNILPITTIEKTYKIRDEVFGTKTSKTIIILYFLHIKFYRKYLFSDNKLKGFIYLGLASLLRPDKVLKKILSLKKLKSI